MTGVLHVQSRAYPLHYSRLASAPQTIQVPGRGEIHPVPGTLGSLVYNSDRTVEVDLTALVVPSVDLPGIRIVSCHARVLAAGALLVVYALRHEVDLRTLDVAELVDLDARVNYALREADRPILEEVLGAAVRAGLLGEITPRPDVVIDADQLSVDRRAVRYNCHFITRNPSWDPDPRVPPVITGPGCRILLPYTYSWDSDPAARLIDILTMVEPTDVAVAQAALLAGATAGGRRILADLASADRNQVDVHAFRRFLDGVWADYHHIDTYRLDSAQHHRATFLAAHLTLGLDSARQRAEELLRYVGASLLSESSLRSGKLDERLNRVAAALTVVSAAAFMLDIATFLLPNSRWEIRGATVTGVLALAVGILAATIFAGRRGRSAPH
ncbi:MAG: hypothetical protein ACRDTC_23505 [Pseudonocardiaceae bacterium]